MPTVFVRPSWPDPLGAGALDLDLHKSPSCGRLVSGSDSLSTALEPASNIASYLPSNQAHVHGSLLAWGL